MIVLAVLVPVPFVLVGLSVMLQPQHLSSAQEDV